jgi:hypothetical protein
MNCVSLNWCEEKEQTIRAGKSCTAQLLTANCGGDLLTKLLATIKQVLSPHHSTTKEIELTLKKDERRKRLTKLPAV